MEAETSRTHSGSVHVLAIGPEANEFSTFYRTDHYQLPNLLDRSNRSNRPSKSIRMNIVQPYIVGRMSRIQYPSMMPIQILYPIFNAKPF